MLKINLLPSSYRQRGLVRRALVLSVLAAILTAGSLLYYDGQLQKQANAIQEQITAATPARDESQRLQSEASSIRGQIQPILDHVGFMDSVVALPEKWVAILNNAAQYTHADIALLSMAISGNALTMQGHAPNMRTAARYYLNALRNPEWTSVTINSPPGYPGTAAPADVHPRFRAQDYPLQIRVTLANAVTVPQAGRGAGAGGGMGMMDPGMMGPGMDPGMGGGITPEMAPPDGITPEMAPPH